jgi:hydroxymethylpyrimidine pyrophosphatase-like HAD family hydrolase
MKPPIKVICTDFDGTVFAEFEPRPIPDCLVKQLAELQDLGAKWIINTGRDLSSLMEALGRSHIPIHPDYLVVVEREIYVRDGLSYHGLKRWNEACLADHDQLFRQLRRELPELSAWVARNHRATLYEDDYSPLCLIAESNDTADKLHDYLQAFAGRIPCLAVVRNDVYMRFCHSAYNKGSALSEICGLLGVSPQETFVAGDHLNDLPMLQGERAAWRAAPANATRAVREVIRDQGGYLSPFNAGEGVTDALRWCLKAASL